MGICFRFVSVLALLREKCSALHTSEPTRTTANAGAWSNERHIQYFSSIFLLLKQQHVFFWISGILLAIEGANEESKSLHIVIVTQEKREGDLTQGRMSHSIVVKEKLIS